jgi:hypothetical protein
MRNLIFHLWTVPSTEYAFCSLLPAYSVLI